MWTTEWTSVTNLSDEREFVADEQRFRVLCVQIETLGWFVQAQGFIRSDSTWRNLHVSDQNMAYPTLLRCKNHAENHAQTIATLYIEANKAGRKKAARTRKAKPRKERPNPQVFWADTWQPLHKDNRGTHFVRRFNLRSLAYRTCCTQRVVGNPDTWVTHIEAQRNGRWITVDPVASKVKRSFTVCRAAACAHARYFARKQEQGRAI